MLQIQVKSCEDSEEEDVTVKKKISWNTAE
jgi:hypothetical protein